MPSIRLHVRSLPSLSVRLCSPLLALAGLLVPGAAGAQVAFNGMQTTLVTGLNAPNGLATDDAGNLYIADTYNDRVVEAPAGGGSLIVLAANVNQPNGVALDGAGNVYFSEYGVGVVKIPVGGGTPFALPITGINVTSAPYGVLVDGKGDVFMADLGNNVVIELPWTGSHWGTQKTIGTGLQTPCNLAMDSSGDLFITEADNYDVVEVPWTGTAFGQQFVLLSGFGTLQGVAVDATGNVFVSIINSGQVLESPADGARAFFLPSSVLMNPTGLAVDGKGDVLVAEGEKNRIVELEPSSVGFGSVAVGSAPVTESLSFSVSGGTTVGSIAVLTSGATGMDFSKALSSTCTATAYPLEATCQITVAFSPLVTGLRQGAVIFYDSTGNVQAIVPVYGVGTGPQVVFDGVAPVSVAGGMANLHDQSIAVDGAGNLYVATAAPSGVVTKFTRSGSAYSAGTALASGLNYPYNVAVDGAGNVFVCTFNISGAVLEIAKTPTGYNAPATIASSLPYILGLAVDGAGNLFFANYQDATISEIPLTSSGYDVPETVAFGVSDPIGIVVDENEDLLVTSVQNTLAQPSSGSVVKFRNSSIGYGAPVTILGGLETPWGIALEPGGSILLATSEDTQSDDHTGAITVIPAVGSGFGNPYQIAAQLSYPAGLAVDGAGDIFLTDGDSGSLLALPRGTAPSLAFTTAAGGATGSTEVVAVEDIGTAPLDFAEVSYAADFPEGPGGFASDCTAFSDLAPGANCTLTIQFDPVAVSGTSTAIPLSESVKVTSNNLNVVDAVQSLTVTGTETKEVSSLALMVSNASPNYNSQINLTVTATADSPATGTPTGTVTFYAGGTPISSPLLLVAGTLTIQATITSNFTLTAVYSGDTYFAGANSNAVPITYKQTTPAVLLTPTPASTLTGASATFTWSSGGGVTTFEFRLGTTGPGSTNVYNAAEATTTALTSGLISNIPINGATLYARLYSWINGAWQYSDYTYTELGTPVPAALTAPTPGSTLTGSSATFTWSAGAGVSVYQFRLGTTGAGSANLYNAAEATTTALTSGLISNIPTNGATLYARIYSWINGAWQYKDYTYTEFGTPVPAALTSPTPGSTLTASSATFTWSAGTGVTLYEFRLGSTGPGSANLYNAAETSTTALTSGLVSSIPTTSATIYARLYSYIKGAWQYTDYTYTEFGTPVPGALTSPTPSGTLTGSSATFTWSAGQDVTLYEFRLGSTGPGSANLYNAAETSTTALTSGLVSSIPTTGATIYARLYSYIKGAWQYTDYTYTEFGAPVPAALTAPTPSGTLTGSSATFTWSAGQDVTLYEFRLGSTGPGSANLYNAAETSTTALTSGLVSNIPTTGATIYARLYSYIKGAWQYTDYTYTEAH